jgi:hypothetical protein
MAYSGRDYNRGMSDEVRRNPDELAPGFDEAPSAELEPDPSLAAEVERRVVALHAGTMKTAPWSEARLRIWALVMHT